MEAVVLGIPCYAFIFQDSDARLTALLAGIHTRLEVWESKVRTQAEVVMLRDHLRAWAAGPDAHKAMPEVLLRVLIVQPVKLVRLVLARVLIVQAKLFRRCGGRGCVR